jgi:N-methylhydantoinase B
VAWDGVARGYVPPDPPTSLSIDPNLPLHETGSADVDPVTFEVIRYALLNANVEHGQTLQRLCVSPITMLTRDFQPSILTQRGELVFLGPYLQYFSNAQALTIRWILENRSSDPGIGPGDMFLSNDPYVGTPHQPDTIVAAPVFADGQLFCWVANVLHHSDIGGSVVGSFCVDAPDIFTDPPAFPPFKIVEAGRVRTDLEQVFLRQSRLPGVVQMDLRAAVSANTVTTAKIEALIARYGADAVKTVMTRVIEAGEEVFLQRLRQIPDGTWSHRLYAEASHTGDTGLYRYQLTVRKRGDELVVDNAGTDPQAGSINVTYAGLVGAFLSALTASLTPDLAGAYGGVYRRVRFEPVPGTLSCADFPAAVSPAGVFTMELLISLSGSVIAKMVAAGPPELRDGALGPSQPHWYGTIMAGQYSSGAPYIAVNANNMVGALPASSDADGADFGGHFWIPEPCGAARTGPGRTGAGAASPRPTCPGAPRAWRRPCTSTIPSPRRSARSAPTRAAWAGS